jgi:hypothetical protein
MTGTSALSLPAWPGACSHPQCVHNFFVTPDDAEATMPQNLDTQTRNVVLLASSSAITVMAISCLYAQWVVMPRLRRRSKSTARPLLGLGCFFSIALMLLASALLTQLIVKFGGGGGSSSLKNEDDEMMMRDVSSSINFCEDDFVDSPHIAEPANTASSIASYCPLALLGVYGKPSMQWTTRVAGHKRFVVAYITLMAIGIGSTTLHALLSAVSQGGDELPMLWFMASLSFCTMDIIMKGTFPAATTKRDTQRWYLLWGFSSSAVVATGVYVFSRDNFLPFYIMFTLYVWVAIVGVLVICFGLKWKDDAFRGDVLLPLATCAGWMANLAVVAWVSEMLFCTDAQSTEWGPFAVWMWNRVMHPLWHCLSALLAYLLIQVLLAGQGLQQGWGEPQLRWWGAPYVIFHKP